MENISMATIAKVRTGPKSKAPKEKTHPITVYARIIDIEKVSGKKVTDQTSLNAALEPIRAELREHFGKMLKKAN